MHTDLTTAEINRLAQKLTDERLGRAASPEKAARRFAKLLADRIGEDRARAEAPEILASPGFEVAEGALHAALEEAEAAPTEASVPEPEHAPGRADEAPEATPAPDAADAAETPDAAAERDAPRLPRAGSKQARLIEMLRDERGHTIAELAAALGWEKHTVRGCIAGALKKRLGLDVRSERIAGRGKVFRIPAEE